MDLNGLVDSGATCFADTGECPLKGEAFTFGQLSFYGQDEFEASSRFSLTYGVRIDMPLYFTDPVDNPFSRDLNALDQDGNSRSFDQSELPGIKPLFSPRVGFNWAATENRSLQLRGGTGVFTGRIPFVWGGNNYSNPGFNPNIWSGGTDPAPVITGEGCTSAGCQTAVLQQGFYVNAFDPDFKSDLGHEHRVRHEAPWRRARHVRDDLRKGPELGPGLQRRRSGPVRHEPDRWPSDLRRRPDR
jgi:hypothetical protein